MANILISLDLIRIEMIALNLGSKIRRKCQATSRLMLITLNSRFDCKKKKKTRLMSRSAPLPLPPFIKSRSRWWIEDLRLLVLQVGVVVHSKEF